MPERKVSAEAEKLQDTADTSTNKSKKSKKKKTKTKLDAATLQDIAYCKVQLCTLSPVNYFPQNLHSVFARNGVDT